MKFYFFVCRVFLAGGEMWAGFLEWEVIADEKGSAGMVGAN